jgi:hypothetical protein
MSVTFMIEAMSLGNAYTKIRESSVVASGEAAPLLGNLLSECA